jgi:transcriptional regulator with XRE-family HTH domain
VRPKRNAEEFVPQDDAADDVQTDLAPVREKIRELREARGWTQEKLAELSGLGPDTIVRIERGRTGTPPKRSTLILLSLIFGRERDYLVNIMKHVPQREDDNPTLQSVSNVLAEFRGTLGSIKEDVKQQRDILYQIAPAVGVAIDSWRQGPTRDTAAPEADSSE